MHLKLAFLVLILTSSLCFSSFGQEAEPDQEQPPRFEIGVNFVQVDVVVTDQEGRRIMDLEAEDFEILEEDQVQDVASFRIVDVPVERDVAGTVISKTDVGTNHLAEEGRVYVLVLDGLHIASQRTGRARRMAQEFVQEYVGPEDLAAVVATSAAGQAAQPLTNNRALLQESIDMFQGDRLPSPSTAVAGHQAEREQMVSPLTGEPVMAVGREVSPDPFENDRAFRARRMLQVLRGVGELLGSVEGRRKAVLFITEGIDYDLYGLLAPNQPGADFLNRSPMGAAILAEMQRTIGAVARSNTAIYCLDPSGLSRSGQTVSEVPTQPVSPVALYAEQRQRHDNLRVLSGETGGVAILNRNDYTQGLRQVVEDTSHYYLLGYYPTNQELEGEYREIRVKVNRSGLTVRARKGYVAGSADGADETATAGEEDLFNPMELAEIPLRVAAGALKLNGRNAKVPVVVEMGIDGFEFLKEEEKLRDRVELIVVALDKQGQTVASEGRMLEIVVSSRVRDLMLRHGFRAMTRLDLPPGAYQIRVMAREEGAAKKGTVFFDLEVPGCRGSSPTMGGVFVGSLRQSFIPVSIAPEEKDEFAFAPSTVRRFALDDELLVQTEVCLSGKALVFETDVRDSNGGLLFRDAKSYESREATVLHRARVPLDDLGPGSYLLHLTARDPSGGGEAVRELAFEIFP